MKVGVLMDSLSTVQPSKDSTIATLIEAQKRGHSLFYMQLHDVFCEQGQVCATLQSIQINEQATPWFMLGPQQTQPLNQLDLVLMRKDPPFNMNYLYATYLLELSEQQGAWVLNRPNGLRTANEKMFTQWFPSLIPPTLVTSVFSKLQSFIDEQADVVLKPLNERGGRSVFHIQKENDNRTVVLDWLTQSGTCPIMAQRFIPDILKTGDKRITLFAGQPVPYALARTPSKGDFRSNLAAGGTGVGIPLTTHDRHICEQVSPVLMEQGLVWVGLDVIGGYLTEMNVTSPTGTRELDRQFGINSHAPLWDWIEKQAKD